MQVKIESVDRPIVMAKDGELFWTRYPIVYSTDQHMGHAMMQILHTNDPADPESVQSVTQGKLYTFGVSVEDVKRFQGVTDGGRESVSILDNGKTHRFEGKVIYHHITGEGSRIQLGDILIDLSVDMLPPYSLEVALGTWVVFEADTVVLHFQTFSVEIEKD